MYKRQELGESQALTGGARGDLATVALRGLSSGNTLVLVNGRRLAPFPIAGSETQTPALIINANQIPTAAIERVEVLRDGASAIYGSDATAGVINTILKRNYNGLEFNLRYGQSEGSTLKESKFTASFGRRFNSERTSLSLIYDYFDRTPLLARDRDYAKSADLRRLAPYPWNGTVANENDFDNRSTQTEFGSFRRGNVGAGFVVSNPTARPTQLAATQMNANGSFFMVPTATGALALQAAQPSRVPTDPASDYYFDINPYRFMIPATTRHNIYSVLEHKLSDRLTFFGEVAFGVARERHGGEVPLLGERQALLGAEDHQGRREGVGLGRSRSNDGRRGHAIFDRVARAGIDRVGEASAVRNVEGTVVAGGRESLVRELDDGVDLADVLDGLLDRDAPGLAVGTVAGGVDLAADLDQEIAAAELHQSRRDVVRRIAGRDRREIDLDIGIEFVEESAALGIAATDVDDLGAGVLELSLIHI